MNLSTPTVFVVFIFFLSSNAFSITIYDESIDGDLPGNSSALEDLIGLEFTLGENIVRGSAPWSALSSEDPGDGFLFTVPVGKKLRMILTEDIYGLQPSQTATWMWDLFEKGHFIHGCAGDQLAFHNSGPYEPPGYQLPKLADIEIGAGDYCIYFNYRFNEPIGDETFDSGAIYMDYVLSAFMSEAIDSYSVPLPTFSIYFLAFSILSLVLATSHNQAQKSAHFVRPTPYRSRFWQCCASYFQSALLKVATVRKRYAASVA